jgi:hypothetical protein
VAELPRSPASASAFGNTVGVFECNDTYAPGVYEIGDLTVSPFDPARPYPQPRVALTAESAANIAARADYLVINDSCTGITRPSQLRAFEKIGDRQQSRLYARKP